MSAASNEIPSSYRDYVAEALEIVRKVIENSVNIVKNEVDKEAISMQPSSQSAPEQPPTIEWPLGKDFTVDGGKEAIRRFIETWHIGNSWKFCIDYLNCQNDLHCYAVKYSEPTRRKPVPKATASVYFYIHIHDEDVPVLVKFIVEGQRTPFTPENAVFHEIWLRNVIQNKLAISKASQITCQPDLI